MNLGDLYGVVLTFVLVGLILGIGLLVLSNFSSSQDTVGAAQTCAQNATVCSSAQTAITQTGTAIGTISSTWLPVIVVIVAAAIILGLVMRSFGNRR